MNKQKSIRRQLKRGRLKYVLQTRIVGWDTSAVLGGINPIFREIPILLKRTKRGRWIPQ